MGEESIYEVSGDREILDELLSIAKTDLQIIAKMCPHASPVTKSGFLSVCLRENAEKVRDLEFFCKKTFFYFCVVI